MILEVSELSRSFGSFKAVDRLSFQAPEGKLTALIGPNGAGKTTAFNLMSGFLPPDSGRIRFCGVDISGWRSHQIAAVGMARSFQEIRVFQRMKVIENVMVGRAGQSGENPALAFIFARRWRQEEAANRVRAMELLEFVGLAEKSDALAEELSYGQQKLLSIARLLALEPKLLLLDEPVSGLDPVILGQMAALMRRLVAAGKSILLIEHNMDLVRQVADQIVFLDHGTAIASGTPEEVLGRGDLVRLYLGL